MPIDTRFDRPLTRVDGATEEVVDAVHRVVPRSDDQVPLHEPEFAGAEWAYLKECIDTGWVSYRGSFVDRFERDLAAACGVRHAIAMVNGTAALQVAAIVAGVRAGDEVLVPSLTFVATANAIHHAGAVPHFVECEPDTLCVDIDRLAKHLDRIAVYDGGDCRNRVTGRRIAALVPVHVFGHPTDPDRVGALAGRFGLPVIADATEALGSSWRDQPAASLGDLGVLSFNGNKIVTTGGGGAIVTDREDLADVAKHLTTTAKKPHRWAFDHDRIGFNFRMPNINAALGCAQLERLTDFVARKRRLHALYRDAFADVKSAAVLTEQSEARSNYWLVALRLDDESAASRDEVLTALHAAGLLSRPIWTPMHMMSIYRDCPQMELACTEDMFARVINLPSSPGLARRAG